MINHVRKHRLVKAIELIEDSYKYIKETESKSSIFHLEFIVEDLKKEIEKANKYDDLLNINWEERRSFRVFCVKCIKDYTKLKTSDVNKITKNIKWSKELVSCYTSALRDAPNFMFNEIKKSLKYQMIQEYEKQTVS
jgi:hypothetical protein